MTLSFSFQKIVNADLRFKRTKLRSDQMTVSEAPENSLALALAKIAMLLSSANAEGPLLAGQIEREWERGKLDPVENRPENLTAARCCDKHEINDGCSPREPTMHFPRKGQTRRLTRKMIGNAKGVRFSKRR